jgi:hypothetical protein
MKLVRMENAFVSLIVVIKIAEMMVVAGLAEPVRENV